MECDEKTRNCLDLTAKILIRGFALGFIVLLFWFVMILAFGDFAFNIHHRMFSISKEAFILINYCGMGLFKLFIFCAFLLPYISIRWALRKNGA